MSHYHSGKRKELWLLDELRQDPDCLSVTRASRSLGAFDLVAVMREETWFIQVKGHTTITPAERRKLEALSSTELHRVCWVVFVIGDECLWQQYLDPENESGKPSGWYNFPGGPYVRMGDRVRLRGESKC